MRNLNAMEAIFKIISALKNEHRWSLSKKVDFWWYNYTVGSHLPFVQSLKQFLGITLVLNLSQLVSTFLKLTVWYKSTRTNRVLRVILTERCLMLFKVVCAFKRLVLTTFYYRFENNNGRLSSIQQHWFFVARRGWIRWTMLLWPIFGFCKSLKTLFKHFECFRNVFRLLCLLTFLLTPEQHSYPLARTLFIVLEL